MILVAATSVLACSTESSSPGATPSAATCGDGAVAASEACDDGNTTSGDGCSAACTVEAGWFCQGAPSACAATGAGEWMWVTGSDAPGAVAAGARGVASPDSTPWSTVGQGATWVDSRGRLWLFGGFANVTGGPTGHLGDLWMFDGWAWTWIGGPGILDTRGSYGTRGVAAASNVPGGRHASASWADLSGNLWLFGGAGLDSAGTVGSLNDLWRFDGSLWTWVGGSNLCNQVGSHGTKGVPSATNAPEARVAATSWVDASGNFWLFGGQGYMGGNYGQFNDLWRFDGNTWTWVSGSSGYDDPGSYGVQGVAAASNVPPARFGAASWVDLAGNLWLFGGYYDDNGSTFGDLNDLWRFDGSQWTWMGGSNGLGAATVFGTQGVAAAGNVPGARRECVSWTDTTGNFWLFGGGGYVGELNELWRFDGSLWTWIGGSSTAYPGGVYGTKGIPAPGNAPGGRSSAASWTDRHGNFWLFGGLGVDASGARLGAMNDLWRYRPTP